MLRNDELDEPERSTIARAVAESVNAEMFTIIPSSNDFADVLQKLVYHMDEPVADAAVRYFLTFAFTR